MNLTGTFQRHPDNPKTWKISGSCKLINTTTVKVTEIPPHFTYEKYEEVLNKVDRKEWSFNHMKITHQKQ